jgi:hypothetical protein
LNTKHYQQDHRRDKTQKLEHVERKKFKALANVSRESGSTDVGRLTNNRFPLTPARFYDHFAMNAQSMEKTGRQGAS